MTQHIRLLLDNAYSGICSESCESYLPTYILVQWTLTKTAHYYYYGSGKQK